MPKRRQPKTTTQPADKTTKTGKTDRNENLTVRDINRDASTRVMVTGNIRVWTGDRSALIVEVIVGSKHGPKRDYFLTLGRPDFIGAKKQLGANIGAWAGKVLEVQPDPTKQYVNVVDEDRPQQATAAAPSTTKADDDIPF